MHLAFDSFYKQYILTLKGAMGHKVALGTDARGTLTPVDNALSQMPERIQRMQAPLDNCMPQAEAKKAEISKHFPQEAELQQKPARWLS